MLVMGKANMVFECDAKVVVDAIHAATVDLSEFSTVIAKCKSLLLQGCNYSVQFFRRQANVKAHSLARASPLHAGFYIFDFSPDYIRNLVPVFASYAT